MTERSALSVDDFVSSLGSGAVTETEPEAVETTQIGDPQASETEEATITEEAESEGGDEETEDDGDLAETDQDEAEAEGDELEGEAETEDDGDVVEDDDQDDEEVLKETFQWDDGLEVDVPGIGKTTLEELRRNHLREADYIRKTQEFGKRERELNETVDAKGKALDDERQLLTQRRETLEATLDVMRQDLRNSRPSLEEREKLLDEDPHEYHRQQLRWEQQEAKMAEYGEQVKATKAEESKAAEAKEAELRQQQEAFINEQREALHGKIPEWRDQEKFGRAMTDLADMIDSYGISADELNNTVDHRQLVLLNDFMGAKSEIARLEGELAKVTKKAARVENAKPALKKKVQASKKRIKPVSSAPAEPRDKAAAFLEKVKKQSGGTMTLKEFAQYTALGGK